MFQSEKEKLFSRKSEYLSIGISEDGVAYGQYPVPWDYTANAYNMRLPNVFISKDDLEDKEIMAKICEFKVCGCYIFCHLDDYSFLNRFADMSDLNIYSAHNLKDLSFLNHYKDCRMLFISKAHLKNIDEVAGKGSGFVTRPRCLALYDCIVDDISYIKEKKCNFNELVIHNPKSRNERERWEGLYRLRYYDIKDPS